MRSHYRISHAARCSFLYAPGVMSLTGFQDGADEVTEFENAAEQAERTLRS